MRPEPTHYALNPFFLTDIQRKLSLTKHTFSIRRVRRFLVHHLIRFTAFMKLDNILFLRNFFFRILFLFVGFSSVLFLFFFLDNIIFILFCSLIKFTVCMKLDNVLFLRITLLFVFVLFAVLFLFFVLAIYYIFLVSSNFDVLNQSYDVKTF